MLAGFIIRPWVDLDTITDDLEREATVGIIHNCEFVILMLASFRTELICAYSWADSAKTLPHAAS